MKLVRNFAFRKTSSRYCTAAMLVVIYGAKRAYDYRGPGAYHSKYDGQDNRK